MNAKSLVALGLILIPMSHTLSLSSPSEAQIDHVVALSNAWQMGADLWTDEMRTEYANDPLNLLVTIASLNRQKSDSTPLLGYLHISLGDATLLPGK